jgi:hypothetical protein
MPNANAAALDAANPDAQILAEGHQSRPTRHWLRGMTANLSTILNL